MVLLQNLFMAEKCIVNNDLEPLQHSTTHSAKIVTRTQHDRPADLHVLRGMSYLARREVDMHFEHSARKGTQRALQKHASNYITPSPTATASLHNTCPAQSISQSHLLVYHAQVVAARKAVHIDKLLQVQP